jgi:hypothetical protein
MLDIAPPLTRVGLARQDHVRPPQSRSRCLIRAAAVTRRTGRVPIFSRSTDATAGVSRTAMITHGHGHLLPGQQPAEISPTVMATQAAGGTAPHNFEDPRCRLLTAVRVDNDGPRLILPTGIQRMKTSPNATHNPQIAITANTSP